MTHNELTEQILIALIRNPKIVTDKTIKDREERDRLIKLAYNISVEFTNKKDELQYHFPKSGEFAA